MASSRAPYPRGMTTPDSEPSCSDGDSASLDTGAPQRAAGELWCLRGVLADSQPQADAAKPPPVAGAGLPSNTPHEPEVGGPDGPIVVLRAPGQFLVPPPGAQRLTGSSSSS